MNALIDIIGPKAYLISGPINQIENIKINDSNITYSSLVNLSTFFLISVNKIMKLIPVKIIRDEICKSEVLKK